MSLKIIFTGLLSMILLTACRAAGTAAPPVQIPVETVTSDLPGITLLALKDGTFKTEMLPAGTVTLAGGAYEERTAPGASGILKIELMDPFAVGDLNEDGIQDSVVILRTDSGGSGRFYELSAAVGQGDRLAPVAALLLGDRVQIQSININDQKITIKMIIHGPDDPMCCPSLEVSRVYQLQGGALVEMP